MAEPSPPAQRPAPTVDSPPPGLPSSLLAVLVVTLALLPLGLAAASATEPDAAWREAATGLGMAALALMALQFASSGRFPLLSGRVGIDRTMAFHKFAARLLALFVLLHPLLYAMPAFLRDPARGWATLEILFLSERYRLGLVAWIATLALVLLAVLRTRIALRYEAWRATHAVLAVLAVGAGAGHALEVGTYAEEAPGASPYWVVAAGAAVASLVFVYLGRTLAMRRDPWRLVASEVLARGTWRLRFRRDSGRPFSYRAGQFVWLATEPRLFPLFDHPFSIASSPRDPEVALVIKEAGDYTNGIGALPPGTRAGLDGPHGAFVREGRAAPGGGAPTAILLVAGGAGIAPILGLARDLAAVRDPRPVRVLIAVGGPDRLAGADEIRALAGVLDLRVVVICETAPEGFPAEIGRADAARLGALLDGLDPAGTLALICGPGPFMVAVSDALLDLGLPEDLVLYERFDYADGTLSRLDRRERRRFRAVGAAIVAGIVLYALR